MSAANTSPGLARRAKKMQGADGGKKPAEGDEKRKPKATKVDKGAAKTGSRKRGVENEDVKQEMKKEEGQHG